MLFCGGMDLKQTKYSENNIDAHPQICDMSTEEISSWSSMFVVEIHRQDGKHTPVPLQDMFYG